MYIHFWKKIDNVNGSYTFLYMYIYMYICIYIHEGICIYAWYEGIHVYTCIDSILTKCWWCIGCPVFMDHFPQRALQLVALLRKETCNLRHPMHLRHPVASTGGTDRVSWWVPVVAVCCSVLQCAALYVAVCFSVSLYIAYLSLLHSIYHIHWLYKTMYIVYSDYLYVHMTLISIYRYISLIYMYRTSVSPFMYHGDYYWLYMWELIIYIYLYMTTAYVYTEHAYLPMLMII